MKGNITDAQLQGEPPVTSNFVPQVFNPARIAALKRLRLLDTPAEAAFDRLGQLAREILKTSIALVTLVDDTRQFFKSCLGLPEPWSTWRETPLSHSFCKHVVSSDAPLVVSDARNDPLFRENLAIKDLGVIAYLGVPLRAGGHVLGSFCVIDDKPHIWSERDVNVLTTLAESVMTEVALRTQVETTHEALDQLSAAHEALHGFHHAVAHDMRAALRQVRSFAHVLQEESGEILSPECREYVVRIQDGVTRLQATFDALLRLSLASSRDLRFESVNLSQIVAQVQRDLENSEPERHVEFFIEPDLRVRGDEGLLRIALDNLVRNAWKFTGKEEHPRIGFGRVKDSNPTTYFVRDNGIGFRPEEAFLLLTPFARLSSAREFPGTGVGLQTVRRIVERHAGKIWAEPSPGRGATFYFSLPSQGDAASLARRDIITSESLDG